MSESSAIFLNKVYKDSILLGKLGDLPSYKDIRKSKSKPAKYQIVADKIDYVLDESNMDSISFSKVKKEIREIVDFIVSDKMWRAARGVARNDSNWIENGRSYKRN